MEARDYLGVWIKSELKEDFKELCAKKSMSMNKMVERLLEQFVYGESQSESEESE